MKQLAKFSIESETLILLQFTDTSTVLVSIEKLSQYLEGSDLIRVQRAVNLRRHFIKRSLPPWALGFGALATAALLLLSTSHVAGWYRLVPLPKPVEVYRASVTPVAKAKLALNDQLPPSPPAQDDPKPIPSAAAKADPPAQPKSDKKAKDKSKKAKPKPSDDNNHEG